jgi:hypothetical protein
VDTSLIRVVDELAREFGDLAPARVIRVMTDCVEEYPSGSPEFIRQAVRLRLAALREQ